MKRPGRLTILVLLIIVSVGRGDAVLLKDGSLLKGRVDHQTARRVVLEITSYTRMSIPREDVGLVVVSEEGGGYTRFADGPAGTDGGLQMATILFEHPRTHMVVSLVGAIHVGDAAYYRDLRTILDSHDRVLYELVTGKNTDGFSEVYGRFSGTIGRLLQLESQKTIVDYGRPPKNWVHADLSWSRLKRELEVERLDLIPREKQEEMKTILGYVDKYMKFAEVVGLSRGTALILKRLLGKKMGQDLDATLEQLEMAKSTERRPGLMGRMMRLREKKAMKVLRRELRRKRHESFAVFYGAGHMPYFEMRLRKMGFEKLGVAWVTAWKVP
jgi:hypothetical protein